ncbi:MAG: hypothetical protein Q4Q07_10730 [Tissierellia bacterium]|nr:hypothetical protein [Tissierellia bacterium]
MDQGKIIEEGSHENLLNNPMYRNLWNRFIGTKEFEFKVEGEQ